MQSFYSSHVSFGFCFVVWIIASFVSVGLVHDRYVLISCLALHKKQNKRKKIQSITWRHKALGMWIWFEWSTFFLGNGAVFTRHETIFHLICSFTSWIALKMTFSPFFFFSRFQGSFVIGKTAISYVVSKKIQWFQSENFTYLTSKYLECKKSIV